MLEYSKLKEEFEYPDAKSVEFGDEQIFVKQYLPLEDKYGIIYVCLLSLDLANNSYNPLLGETLFDLEVVKMYSNVNFENIEDSYFKQFDILQVSGLMELVVANIPQEEYEELQRLYDETIQYEIDYSGNIGNVVQNFLKNLPNLNEEINSIDNETLEKGIDMIEKLSRDKHI